MPKRPPAQGLTCPFCGAISDRTLFDTLTLKSLQGTERSAYEQGFQDCEKQRSQTGSSEITPERYRPTAENENAYRAGWQNASDKLEAAADRKFGRKRGLRVLLSGVGLLALGTAVALVSGSAANVTVWYVTPLGLGAVNIIIGIAMIVTGTNDEART